MANSSEQTEKPTPRRRQRAKEDGKFAYSQELTAAVALATTLTVFYYTLNAPERFRVLLGSVLNAAAAQDASPQALTQIVRTCGTFFFVIAAPAFLAAGGSALAAGLVQGFPVLGANTAGLKWDHLNPIHGFSKLKAKLSWMEWVKVLVFVTVIARILWSTLSESWQRMVALPAYGLTSGNVAIRDILARFTISIIATCVVLAVGDFLYQRWRYEKSLMQTKAEVKEDMRASDGNPAIKGKIRSLQRQQARRRMIARVKDADVIITNPTHYAVALEYKPALMTAPRVIAKGVGWLAQRIKEEGRNNDIVTVENVPLARALCRSVGVDQEIPMVLYKAVAEVLAYVFRTRKRM